MNAALVKGVHVIAFATGLSAVQCKSQADRDAEREVARIAHAVNELRAAPHNAKDEPLKRLRSEACKAPQACELQQLCVQGYALHQKAIDNASRVREALRQGAGKELAGDLLQLGERDLNHAKALLDRCVARQGELERDAL